MNNMPHFHKMIENVTKMECMAFNGSISQIDCSCKLFCALRGHNCVHSIKTADLSTHIKTKFQVFKTIYSPFKFMPWKIILLP